MPTGAQLIVELLEEQGVEVAFGLPGVHNLPLWEALRGSSIRLVGVRHEQTAAYAADGYARATGRLGVAIVTTGPGAANTLGAVGEAWASRSPILVIATDIPAALRRPDIYRGVLHETTDQAAMFAPVTRQTFVATSAEDLPEQAAWAVKLPLAAPCRPAYLQVPTDVLSAPVGAPPEVGSSRHPGRASVRAGGGADRRGGATADLGRLGPVVAARGRPTGRHRPGRARRAPRRARWSPPTAPPASCRRDHPCRVGMPPHVEPVGRLWDEADLVIAVGSDLDGVQTQNFALPQPPRLVAINLDPDGRDEELPRGRGARLARRRACEELASRSRERAPTGSTERLHEVRADACGTLDGRALRFLDAIRFAVPDDGVVVADMCIPGYWLAGFHTPAHPRKLQIPLGWGTLGYAFPAALGAALAGEGPVVAIAGDGGFLYAARRARHGRPGAHPADARDRRRRRLRDAALRPGRDGQPSATASTSSRRTSSRSPARSGSARTRSTGSTTSSARRWPRTSSTTSRACSSPPPRSRSSRRRTRRRTGTGARKVPDAVLAFRLARHR